MKVMVDPAFPDHRKIRALGRALKIHPMQALGHVTALWCRVMQESPDGDLKAWTDDDIAEAAKWDQDPRKFLNAMRSPGIQFIVKKEINGWFEHQGDVLAEREKWKKERARRRAQEKAKKESDESLSANCPPDKQADNSLVRGGQNTLTLSGADNPPVPPLLSLPILSSPIPSYPFQKRGDIDGASAPPTAPPSGPLQSLLDPIRKASTEKPKAQDTNGFRPAVRALAGTWNKGPGLHLNGDKACEQIQAASDAGVDLQDIDVLFRTDSEIRGRKIWEVLDPLRENFKDRKLKETRDASGPPKL